MKCDKEAAGNVGNFLLPLLKYQSFSLSDSFFIIGPMIMAMIIFTRSAGMKGITQTARAALKV